MGGRQIWAGEWEGPDLFLSGLTAAQDQEELCRWGEVVYRGPLYCSGRHVVVGEEAMEMRRLYVDCQLFLLRPLLSSPRCILEPKRGECMRL